MKEVIAKGVRVSKKRPPRRAIEEVNLVPPNYTIEDGLRKVSPYDHVFTAFAKARWIGKPILKVFEVEFNTLSPNYYQKAIQAGRITINGSPVGIDYLVKNNDFFRTMSHRHEPSVSSDPIIIVHETDELLIVSKPSSIPIHPVGKYHHNTLLNILHHEFKYQNLYTINRIDRLTSGLSFMAKTKERAASLCAEFRDHQIQKTYLARVKGHFPDSIECHEPIKIVSFKVGVNMVSPDGKECSTLFKRLSYNGLTSVVECSPKTGRTHQIRVHLQYLGYPIANDPVYMNSAFGENKGKGGIPIDQQRDIVYKVTGSAFANEDCVDSAQVCVECTLTRRLPAPEQLVMWLHSLRYQGSDWTYETPWPDWAQPDFKGDSSLVDRFWAFGGVWDGIPPGTFELNDE